MITYFECSLNISGSVDWLVGHNNIKRDKRATSESLPLIYLLLRLCECAIPLVWCAQHTVPPLWHFKSEPRSLSCLSRFCNDLHPDFTSPRSLCKCCHGKGEALDDVFIQKSDQRLDFSALLLPISQQYLPQLQRWLCNLCHYCFEWKQFQLLLHLCIVSVKWNPDKPDLWCLCLRGSGLNETILHCLSTIHRGWQNTMLILTLAGFHWFPELLVLFASHRRCRHLLTKPNSFQAHQLFRVWCLQETSEKLWWWLQSGERKCKFISPGIYFLIIVLISLYQQLGAEPIKGCRCVFAERRI